MFSYLQKQLGLIGARKDPRSLRWRRRSAVPRSEALEVRVLPAATITPVFETTKDLSGLYRPATPVVNDSGTVLFADPDYNTGQTHFWRTNGGAILPGLTNGFNHDYFGSGGYRPQADINNLGVAVIVQNLNASGTEMELVVYDVPQQKRLKTITTVNTEFHLFQEAEINDAGVIAVIAYEDSGKRGIYFLQGDRLEPAVANVSPVNNYQPGHLHLLDDGRAVFQESNDYYTVAPNGQVEKFAGDRGGDVSLRTTVLTQTDLVFTSGQQARSITFSIEASNIASATQVRFRTRDLTAIAGLDYQAIDTIITIPANTSSRVFDIDVPILPDSEWEGGFEAFAADITLVNPLQFPFESIANATSVGIIRDRGASSTTVGTREVDEPIPESEDLIVNYYYTPPRTSAVDKVVQYFVLPVTATSANVVEASGSITLPRTSNRIQMPVTLLNDQSSAKLQSEDQVFLVIFQVDEQNAGEAQATLVRMRDVDYVRRNDSVEYGNGVNESLAVNGHGDVAYIPETSNDDEDYSKLVVISNDRVVREITGPSGRLSVRNPLLIDDNGTVYFTSGDNAIYRNSNTNELLVLEDTELAASHFANDVGNEQNDFSVSPRGNFIFQSGYSLVREDYNPDGNGIYTILSTAAQPSANLSVPNSESLPTQYYWNKATQDGGFTFSYSISNPAGVNLNQVRVKFSWDEAGTEIASTYLLESSKIDLDGKPVLDPGSHRIQIAFRELTGLTSPPGYDPEANPGSYPYLYMFLDSEKLVAETSENDNSAKLQYVPLVVTMVTHGFNPLSEFGSSFYEPFQNIANALEQLPAANSILSKRVKSFAPQWDSTTSFRPGIISLIGGLLATAKASLAEKATPSNQGEILAWLGRASRLLSFAESTSVMSDVFLYASAFLEVTRVTDQLGGGALLPSTVSNLSQRIVLIGHSRGAGFNAKVGSILEHLGYDNIDYIALDGYGADWVDEGGILSHIDIDKETGFAQQKTNYIADSGLAFDPMVATLMNWSPDFISDAIAELQRMTANTLMAPYRSTFDSGTPSEPGGEVIPDSYHTTITNLYRDRNRDYLNDNYVGDYRTAGLETLSPTTAMSSTNSTSLLSPSMVNRLDLTGFADGNLSKLAGQMEDSLDWSTISFGDPNVDQVIRSLFTPEAILQTFWQTAGDVRFNKMSGNPRLDLRVAASGKTSVAQMVTLPNRAKDLQFQLSVQNASATDDLLVIFGNRVLKTYSLSQFAGSNPVVLSLADVIDPAGTIEFRLRGTVNSSVVASLSQFEITMIAAAAPILQPTQPNLPPIAPGDLTSNLGVPITVFQSQVSSSSPDAALGIAIVAANSPQGKLQFLLPNHEWTNVGPVDNAHTLLLRFQPGTRIRFVPNSNATGTIDDIFRFRGWDQTTTGMVALSGELIDAATVGGTSAFSSAIDTVRVTISETAATLPGDMDGDGQVTTQDGNLVTLILLQASDSTLELLKTPGSTATAAQIKASFDSNKAQLDVDNNKTTTSQDGNLIVLMKLNASDSILELLRGPANTPDTRNNAAQIISFVQNLSIGSSGSLVGASSAIPAEVADVPVVVMSSDLFLSGSAEEAVVKIPSEGVTSVVAVEENDDTDILKQKASQTAGIKVFIGQSERATDLVFELLLEFDLLLTVL